MACQVWRAFEYHLFLDTATCMCGRATLNGREGNLPNGNDDNPTHRLMDGTYLDYTDRKESPAMANEEGKETKVNVKGSAEVTGDKEGSLEVDADVKYTEGAGKPDPVVEAVGDLKAGIDAAFEKFSAATKDAGRDTAKAAVPAQPRAVSRAGRVD